MWLIRVCTHDVASAKLCVEQCYNFYVIPPAAESRKSPQSSAYMRGCTLPYAEVSSTTALFCTRDRKYEDFRTRRTTAKRHVLPITPHAENTELTTRNQSHPTPAASRRTAPGAAQHDMALVPQHAYRRAQRLQPLLRDPDLVRHRLNQLQVVRVRRGRDALRRRGPGDVQDRGLHFERRAGRGGRVHDGRRE